VLVILQHDLDLWDCSCDLVSIRMGCTLRPCCSNKKSAYLEGPFVWSFVAASMQELQLPHSKQHGKRQFTACSLRCAIREWANVSQRS
jgi:hypothetical protein